MEFNYHLPVNLLFGVGKAELLGKETAKYGTKALLVTGQGSTKRTGLLDRALGLLTEAGVAARVFDKVTPNPITDTVTEGVAAAKAFGADVVVALGGGSIIDCAKAIAFAFFNEGDIFDYIYGRKTGERALPLIAVPTTCGTGSEGNCFAVLTDPTTGDKKSLRNMVSVPKASIIDPALMTTMPAPVAASVMFDALCHNMEAYLSRTIQPLVEMQALYGMRLLAEYIRPALRDHADLDAWSAVTLGSTLGGMCINTAGVAAPHGMEHPASGLKNIVHGRGLAALAPVIYRESVVYAPDKFGDISRILGGTGPADFTEQLNALLEDIGLKTTLSKEGITEADIDWMTENCLKVSAPAMAAHPKVFTKEEICELYYKAL
ncbi:MAG: iron-containing alcohol dehydrogenase [Lachnospiraceae bacterium]|nr:iron-containing alcohol dehydrogenase [Lachnospiraceae bacterium]